MPKLSAWEEFFFCGAGVTSGDGEVYDYDVLHGLNNITRLVLGTVTAALWLLYFREILFRSGKVQTQWIKKRLGELGLMILVAVVTILIFSLMTGLQFGHRR